MMKIIDTHIHIWDLEHISYRWLEGNTSILNRTYHLKDLGSGPEDVGVKAGVLVQAENHFEDTDWMLLNAEKHNWIAGVVGWMPLMDPDGTVRMLEKYLGNTYFKGVRHLIHDEKDPMWLLQPEVIESLKILAAHKVPYDVVGVLTTHIEVAIMVAEEVPDLKMVFDHLNQPPIPDKQKYGRWGELMKEASKHSNFYQKISGLGTASGDFNGWTIEDIKPYVEFVLTHFDPKRCFCGGDWPVSLLAGDYVKTWTTYKELLRSLLSRSDQEKIFFSNANEFYNLNL